jgi:hypothetical protein
MWALLPATCQLQSIAKPLSVDANAGSWSGERMRSARDVIGQNDIMQGVRGYDLS